MKIAVVGGGSTYTPELIEGFARRVGALPFTELVLHDISADRLEVVGGLAGRILAKDGLADRLRTTTSLDDAVEGASAVLVQLRVGGQQARLVDETLPNKFGLLGQETTGPGGFAKALRTVPVVLGIAETVAERAEPDAWIVDFTNPVGIVVRALLDEGHRAVGLCNVAIGLQRHIARLLNVDPARVMVDQVGLNHLTWVRRVELDGSDILPELLAEHGDALAEDASVPRDVLERLGVIPSYYLHYFYFHDAELARQRTGTPRAAEVAEIER